MQTESQAEVPADRVTRLHDEAPMAVPVNVISRPFREHDAFHRARLVPDFSISREYYNQTSFELTVYDAKEFPFVLPPKIRTGRYIEITRNDLIIIDRIRMTNQAANRVYSALLTHGSSTDPNFNKFKLDFMERFEEISRRDHDFSYEIIHRINEKEIREMGGHLYLSNLDLILTNDPTIIPNHPRSISSVYNQTLGISKDDGLVVKYYIVDNFGEIGQRLIEVNGTPNLVRPIRNPGVKDGFYILGETADCPRTGDFFSKATYYTAEEMDKLPYIFKNRDQLLLKPNETEQLRVQVQQKDARIRELEEENRGEKAKFEIAKRELDVQIQQLNKQTEEMKHNSQKELMALNLSSSREEASQKSRLREEAAYYERRSAERKDRGEWIKSIPALATFGGLILGFMAKLII